MTPDQWADVDRLFHAALDRLPAERAAFLDDGCAGDALLRHEVESLLGHEAAAAEFLEQPALQLEAASLASVVPGDPQIPGFTILGTLGEGGMGIVYLAQQHDPIHRRVALKLIKHGMDTRRVIARFDAEREALARMQHPHIAAVYDAGTTTDGRPYFVMEYVEGEPVTDYCDRRRLSTRARLELFVDVCAAVQHAHQKGVIHRDLKPSNVLVADADGRPQAKIIDFGVAKATDRSTLGRTAFTEAGTIVGTPEYMSPEQAALSDDIDTATDVYSLGVLLYELLVGALPFDPAMLKAAGFDEMRRIIRESDPARPSARLSGAGAAASAATRQSDAGRLTRQLRGDLDWITLKALEKDRRHRYPTVAAFAADIGHYLVDEPIAARAPSAAYRLRKFARRYRAVMAAASVVLMVLVAGLVASLTQYARAESQRVDANQQRAQADAQRQAALTAAADASAQRNAAIDATGEADRARLVATREAAAALAAQRELEHRAYASTIVAADGELHLGLAASARSRLLAVPPQYRGWEWQHLLLRTDSSVATLDGAVPCDPQGSIPAMPRMISDNALTIDAGHGRVYFRRCASLQVWEGPGSAHATYALPGRVIAVGPAGESLVVSRPGSGAGAFVLQVVEPATARVLQSFAPITAEPICGGFSHDGTRVAVGVRPASNPIGEPLADFFDVWNVATGVQLARLAPPGTVAFDTRSLTSISCMVAFSPDSTRLASSGGTVRVWRLDSGVEVAAGDGQAGTVSQPIAWNADGSRLAIGRASGLVDIMELGGVPRIVHLDGNGLVRELPMPPGDRRLVVSARASSEVLAIAFGADGTRVLTGADTIVGVWGVEERRLRTQLPGHGGRIVGIATEAGGRFWTADAAGEIKVWPPAGQGAVVVLPGAPTVSKIVLSANGAVLATAEMDGGLYLWRLADQRRTILRAGTGVLDRSRPLPPGEPLTTEIGSPAVATNADGTYVLTSMFDSAGTVRTWRAGAGLVGAQALNAAPEPGCENPQAQVPGRAAPQFPVFDMALAPDGRSLAFRQGKCLVVRDLPTSTTAAVLRHFEGGSYRGIGFAFRPDGLLVLVNADPAMTGPGPARVQIWDWHKQRMIAEAPTPSFANASERKLTHAVISPDGSCVAIVGGAPTVVSIWDGDLRRELGRIPVPPDTRDVALSAGCVRLASISTDSAVRIWDVRRREQLLVLVDDDQHPFPLAFTLDGRLIAARWSGGFTIWESVRHQ